MNTYFIGIAAILTVKWYYDEKEKNDRIEGHSIKVDEKKNHYRQLACTLSVNSSDNLHKEGWNNNHGCSSQDKW